jgi:hypothetical protein
MEKCRIELTSKGTPAMFDKQEDALMLVGSWRLISYEEHRDDGSVIPVWVNPRGRLMYDAAGRMSGQIMKADRPSFASSDLLDGTAEEVREAFEGYFAYYGSYTVDSNEGVVTHHVEGSLYPNYNGSDQRRFFRLSGNQLRLRTPPIVSGGRTSEFELVWERDN